jgi:hypothetical protein
MPRQSTVLDIFLSSPSDLDAERDFVLAASQEWNLLHSRDTGCYINVITWEDTIVPALSGRPQQVVNEQVGDDYDVYLGMMWSKLGSPTGKAESGTVEEFDRALDRYRRGEGIRLAMLFKTAPIPTSILNGAQFDGVITFKRRFAEEGGFYGEFETDDELRSVLNRLFKQIASGARRAVVERAETCPAAAIGETIEPVAQDDDLRDIGILDLNEKFASVVSQQTQFLDGWTKILVSNSEITNSANSQMGDLTRFGPAEPADLRPIISRLADTLNTLSEYVETNIPKYSEGNDKIISLTEAGLDLSQDFAENPNGLRSSVLELMTQLLENREATESLIGTTRGLPRMTTEFNRAKKRAVKAQERMLAETDRLRDRLSTTLTAFDQAKSGS